MEVQVPPQVQRQIDEADAYDRSLAPPEATDGTETQPAAPEAPAEVTPPAAPTPPKDDPDSWKARYLSLQGMFNADVPRLNKQVKDLMAEITTLKSAPPAPQPPAEIKGSITDKDKEAFGDDLLDVIKRQAADMIAPAQAQWAAEKAALEAKVTELSTSTAAADEQRANEARNQYYAGLKALVPDYEAINVDPGFLGWLAEVAPDSGIARQAYMLNAFNTMDVNRTAFLFKTWKEAQAPATDPAPAPQTEAKRNLERQRAPDGSKSSTPVPAADSLRMWTGAEIDQHYTDVRRGVYHGKDAEAAAIEAQIEAAAASGRVTP